MAGPCYAASSRYSLPRMTRALALAALLALCATQAHADPCTAPVTGYRAGAVVTGTVRYVGDADSLCIGQGPDPKTWIEIRLADFYGPELNAAGGRAAKQTLVDLTKGTVAVCTVRQSDRGPKTYSYDRLIAQCRVDGASLGDLMRGAGVKEGGNGR